jgi:hypothetical protein
MIMTMLDRMPAAGWVLAAVLLAANGGAKFRPVPGQDTEAQPASLVAQEKQECIHNLNAIYKALEAYQADHKDLPNWLSDLVPKYLADANLLVCPVCRRTGKTETAPLADPNISCSYLFEFCPVPLGASAPTAANRTRREWKRRQMGLIGSKVPIVRCRHHDPLLNLAFDGTVYESPLFWEWTFTNRISAVEFTAARLFANDPQTTAQADANQSITRRFPARDEKARPQLLDLTKFYNAALNESWHGGTEANNLEALAPGLQTIAGVEFDVRGIIQLAGKSPSSTKFPTEVKEIPVHQKCQRLNFLHSAGWGNNAEEGKVLGSYVVHFAANSMRLEIPITYGHAVRDWHVMAGEPPAPKELVVAWKGENAVSKRTNGSIRLFLTTWTNIVPDIEIETIDFTSSLSSAAPFLIAITAE